MTPPKILLWSDKFLPDIGGVEVLSAALLRSLSEMGYQPIVISSFQDDTEVAEERNLDGIAVYRFPFRHALRTQDLGIILSLRRRIEALIADFAPDVVHIPLVGPSLFFLFKVLDDTPIPLVVSLQQDEWRDQHRGGTLVSRVVEMADRVTFCSTWMQQAGETLFPSVRVKGSVIPNSMPVASLEPTDVDLDSRHLVCAGRLSEEKGFDLALNALASVRDRLPRVTMTIAGDGPRRDALVVGSRQLGVDDIVQFMGWIDPNRIPELLNRASCVVVPSRQEAFGLVALQAAMMARPVVATRTGGLPEVVLDGTTGILVPPNDHHRIAEGILQLFAHPDRGRVMAARARARALEQFPWEHHVSSYDTLYRSLRG